MDRLNNIINIDLHIHSKASEYKEENEIVKNSNIDNIEVLLEKLNKNNINMFAITDHNRFDYKLYAKIRETIKNKNSKYSSVLEILPGIEFDVKIENDKKVCHIICIFSNTNKDIEKLENVEKILNENELIKDKSGYYTKEKLENILKEIGLSVVLIAHQHKSLDNPNGGKRSISDSVSNIYDYIATGYINALEYQKPSVQGMILDNLKKSDINIATIIGSDCHDWNAYPKHDMSSKAHEYISKIKALPTFKGLVFSITSPETRFNRYINNNKNYIEKIKINDEEIQLSNGINAIIGDNGSGKSLLMDILSNKNKLDSYYNVLKKKNNIEVMYQGEKQIEYIKQGKIIEDVKNGNLFKEDDVKYYNKIRNREKFRNDIIRYKEKLLEYINKNIEINDKIKGLENIKFSLKDNAIKLYRPKVIIDLDIEDDTIYEERCNELGRLVSELKDEFYENRRFYKEYKDEYVNLIKTIEKIFKKIKEKYTQITEENKIKSYIISASQDFNTEMNNLRTDQEKERLEYIDSKKQFINEISSCILESSKERKIPLFPKPLNGASKKIYNGFVFSKQAKFHMLNLKEQFFEEMFVNDYNYDKIISICTKTELEKALNGISKLEDIENWNKKVEKFIDKYSAEETYIENVSSKESVGNTPGEVSIVYYDFKLRYNNESKSIILIDQPEDDISNQKISQKLITYFNNERDKKQIIIATHNPLLVVNLDVDNVIYLNKNKYDVIEAEYGCLEYEDDKNNIIKYVSDNLDGGIDAIKRRFKIYGN